MNKYRNVRYKGFDSKKEAKRYEELMAMQNSGLISDLQTQVKFKLIPSQRIDGKVVEREVSYKADFVYYREGQMIVEDVKGYIRTPEYIIKRKLMLSVYGIRVTEV